MYPTALHVTFYFPAGYAGKNAWDEARVDMVANCVEDFAQPGFPIYLLNMHMKKDESLKPQKVLVSRGDYRRVRSSHHFNGR